MLSISHTSSHYLEDPNLFVGSPERTKKIKINETPINSLDKVTVPISVTMTLMVGYICGGAVLFSQWEGMFVRGTIFIP